MADSSFSTLFSRSSQSTEDNLKKTLFGLARWAVAGLFTIVIYALSRLDVGLWYIHSVRVAFEIVGYGALLSLACMAVGGLIGFLFGIPRTIQSDERSKDNSERAKDSDYRQTVNTNLEQISDWLTKILVGVGLTQLNNIPLKLWALSDKLKFGLNDNQALTMCVVLNFLVCGFFAGYLLTRLFLAGAFSEADRASVLFIKTKQEVAQQFTSDRQYEKAADALESALAVVTGNTPVEDKKKLYEQLTYNYLYQDSPEGFSKAIQVATQYTEEEPSRPSAKLWANLAFAYGQQYAWELSHNKRQDLLERSKNEALHAIQEALNLEPKMLSLLRMVWDPNDPTKVSAEENDLEVFYGDKDFKSILAG